MEALVQELAAAYASVALLATVGFVLLRAALALLGLGGRHLTARQTLSAGRVTLALALLLPPACMAVRGLIPTGPLFSFERSVVRHTARLAEPVWASASRVPPPRSPRAPTRFPVGVALALGVCGIAGAVCARQLRQHLRLLRRLEALPRARRRVRAVPAPGHAAGLGRPTPSRRCHRHGPPHPQED